MKKKCKFKGEKIFIENDLTWEDRKRQERIGKWVREQKKQRGGCEGRICKS